MFRKIPEIPEGWEDNFTQSEWRDYFLSLRKWDREQKIKAIKSLFRKKNYACAPQHIFRFFIPVVLAIIFNRSYKEKSSKSKCYECWQLTSWDYHQGYGEWSMMCLDFYPKTLEYNIYSDGESTM